MCLIALLSYYYMMARVYTTSHSHPINPPLRQVNHLTIVEIAILHAVRCDVKGFPCPKPVENSIAKSVESLWGIMLNLFTACPFGSPKPPHSVPCQ